jgi:hypothetical protein
LRIFARSSEDTLSSHLTPVRTKATMVPCSLLEARIYTKKMDL